MVSVNYLYKKVHSSGNTSHIANVRSTKFYFIFLSRLHSQYGAWCRAPAYDPEIKTRAEIRSPTLNRLTDPDAPKSTTSEFNLSLQNSHSGKSHAFTVRMIIGISDGFTGQEEAFLCIHITCIIWTNDRSSTQEACYHSSLNNFWELHKPHTFSEI